MSDRVIECYLCAKRYRVNLEKAADLLSAQLSLPGEPFLCPDCMPPSDGATLS